MKKLFLMMMVFTAIGIFFYSEKNTHAIALPDNKPMLAARLELNSEKNEADLKTEKVSVDYAELTYEEKVGKENDLNKLTVKKHNSIPMSGESLYAALVKRGIDVPLDVAQRMKSDSLEPKDLELMNTYIAGIISEEENFKIELSQYENFEALKNAFDKRSKTTGIFYGNDLLSQRAAFKGASLDNVKSILDAGATLPDDVIKNIIASENIELAKQLKDSGYGINVNYTDDFTSMNAMELLVEDLTIKSYKYSGDQQVKLIQSFVDLGVPLKNNDGTRDAMDYLLNSAYYQDVEESKKIMLMASSLNKAGLTLENSHLELLAKLQSKYPDLYNEYVNQLR